MNTRAPELDCRTCGACCSPEFADSHYVFVSQTDVERMTRAARRRLVGHGALLTKVDPVGRCVCVALRGTIGRRASCTIYERRPDECRHLEPGSAACLRAREQAGLAASEG